MSTAGNLDSPADLALASRNAADARLESVLNSLTLQELTGLQGILIEQLGGGLPPIEQVAKALERQDVDVAAWFRFREAREDAVKLVMLLGALGLSIAWMTHRNAPAPTGRLQDAIARISEHHIYMLPIPRSDPCFCGSGSRFRACHGKLPMPAVAV
jgi:hypothetical protein